MMSVDGITNNVVPDDKIALFLSDPCTSSFCKIFRGFCYSGGILDHRQLNIFQRVLFEWDVSQR